MKNWMSIVLLFISLTVFGQQYSFKPNWKVGDTKNISVSRAGKEYQDGQVTSEDVNTTQSVIKVVDEDNEYYTLHVQFENVIATAMKKLALELGESMNAYQNLKLVYKVNKHKEEFSLENWEEARDFIMDSYTAVDKVIAEKNPEMSVISSQIFEPVLKLFQTKEAVEAYMSSEIGFLLMPYYRDFKIGELITKTERTANPFDPNQEISMATKVKLSSVKNNQCIIESSVELDLEEFKTMMKNMVMNMAKSMGSEEEMPEDVMKEFDEMDMDMTTDQKIYFDKGTSWVTKSVTNVNVIAKIPGRGDRRNETIVTVTVN